MLCLSDLLSVSINVDDLGFILSYRIVYDLVSFLYRNLCSYEGRRGWHKQSMFPNSSKNYHTLYSCFCLKERDGMSHYGKQPLLLLLPHTPSSHTTTNTPRTQPLKYEQLCRDGFIYNNAMLTFSGKYSKL